MVFQGGIQENQTVWALADLGLGLMAIINIGCILPISKDAIDSLRDYEENFLNQGKQKNISENLAEEKHFEKFVKYLYKGGFYEIVKSFFNFKFFNFDFGLLF